MRRTAASGGSVSLTAPGDILPELKVLFVLELSHNATKRVAVTIKDGESVCGCWGGIADKNVSAQEYIASRSV